MKLNLSISRFTVLAATSMVALIALGGAAFGQTSEAVDNIARETASQAQQGVGQLQGGLLTIIDRLDQVETGLATTTAKTGSNMQAITDEATARQTEDANLQAQIDALPVPGAGAGFSFVLMDSDPLGAKEVGPVVTPRLGPVVTPRLGEEAEISAVVLLDVLLDINGLKTLVRVSPEFFQLSGGVEFDAPDCGGTAYTFTRTGLRGPGDVTFALNFGSNTLTTTIVATGPSEPSLWALQGLPPVAVTTFSSLFSGGCSNFSSPISRENMAPVVLEVPDLHASFPPPYLLELQ